LRRILVRRAFSAPALSFAFFLFCESRVGLRAMHRTSSLPRGVESAADVEAVA
jgi:hypothetical protein